MTYIFKCRETADVLMLQPDGDAVLRLIGRDPAAQGIIEAEALPAAIIAIERAAAEDEQRLAQTAEDVDAESVAPGACGEVSLRQRTWPLLQMLKSAQAAASAVTWGV